MSHLLLPNRRQFIAALAACSALPGATAAPALLLAQTAPAGIEADALLA